MNIQLKPMKLIFSKNEDNTYNKTITDLNGNIILERKNLIFFEDFNKQYFDDWENQLKTLTWWNIVEVERFI